MICMDRRILWENVLIPYRFEPQLLGQSLGYKGATVLVAHLLSPGGSFLLNFSHSESFHFPYHIDLCNGMVFLYISPSSPKSIWDWLIFPLRNLKTEEHAQSNQLENSSTHSYQAFVSCCLSALSEEYPLQVLFCLPVSKQLFTWIAFHLVFK